MNLYDFIDDIQDFPKKGILFRDISPLLEDRDAFKLLISKMIQEIKNYKIDIIAGIDSRGFLFSSLLAHQLNIGSIMIRKPNKLPGNIIEKKYELEYGSSTLSVQKKRNLNKKNLLIIDDLLATGGTLKCAEELISEVGGKVVLTIVAIELNSLKGRRKIQSDVFSVLSYD
ncbi:MAG: adenine phosphoribosyltransferase [SAR116 cluster bacterium]|nr:adenine phosphoribosyltransferase [SAR116 cluster bacterium]RPH08343.1 MAG: adenine phosphoribosyltransferase [Alphaproteobacteria bacterium TMED54]